MLNVPMLTLQPLFIRLLFGAGVLGIVVGFGGGYFLAPTKIIVEEVTVTEYISEESGERVVKEVDLPVPSNVLINPVHYQWDTSSQGILVEKTDSDFTLERNGVRATFFLMGYTYFSGPDRDPETGISKQTTLEDILLGSELRGGAFVSVSGGKVKLLARGFKVVSLTEE